MSNTSNDVWYDRAGELLPFLGTVEAKRLNKYIQINDLDSFANFVRLLEVKYQINTNDSGATRGAAAYQLKPKTMRVRNFSKGRAWTKNKCTVHFYTTDEGDTVFSFDGNAQAAYQLGLNILHDKQAQQEIGVSL